MALIINEELKAKAEIYYGDEICQDKTKFLLQEVGLPRGLLPLRDIIECGHVKETGFVWLKQKKKVEHAFSKIGRKVTYSPEIAAYVENNKIKKVSGVKAKELLLWLTVEEISAADEAAPEKITFKTTTGLYRTFPRSAFELEEDGEEAEQQKKLPPAIPAPPEKAPQAAANK
ncbi:uncharacterized protein LOC122029528 [Zingiber officinale]|uniref:Uncharacterized protein n=1 Tax=Zingiber officinale TaxID=94328 RepID=A0A8J5C5J2_ZINOF|nr:uncharacterized protein LOC122029528 [Zingiber officinale]KAG6472920.1 hypothetical protein ZIOFF_070398 [Zingiber officinale]